MRSLTILAVGMGLIMGGCASYSENATAANMSHAHMGHVTTAWGDTPDGKGLLPTAMSEAKIATTHAGFAANKLDNLGWMQTHIRHVLNAIDPSVEAKGPGLGYGVINAAKGSAKHIKLASKSEGASKNVQTHAVHVAMSSNNTIERAKEIVVLGNKVLSAKSAAEAAPLVQKIAQLSAQLTAGADANGDGKILWVKGEGGLKAADFHMGLMIKGEGLK